MDIRSTLPRIAYSPTHVNDKRIPRLSDVLYADSSAARPDQQNAYNDLIATDDARTGYNSMIPADPALSTGRFQQPAFRDHTSAVVNTVQSTGIHNSAGRSIAGPTCNVAGMQYMQHPMQQSRVLEYSEHRTQQSHSDTQTLHVRRPNNQGDIDHRYIERQQYRNGDNSLLYAFPQPDSPDYDCMIAGPQRRHNEQSERNLRWQRLRVAEDGNNVRNHAPVVDHRQYQNGDYSLLYQPNQETWRDISSDY